MSVFLSSIIQGALAQQRAFKIQQRVISSMPSRISTAKVCLIVVVLLSFGSTHVSAQTALHSPTDTVRQFYQLMKERKFREAFALSIYKPAIDGLSAQEFEDLRPDFEKMAAAIPEKVDLTGEQISGDAATVFVKVKQGDSTEQPEPASLIKVDGNWIIGDRDNQAIVKKAGKEFFFNARIETHHNEVQSIFQRITLVQIVYSQQHAGKYGTMAELIEAGLLPKDLAEPDSTGYIFHVNKATDGKSWYATAEPAQYGRSGKLSFFLDAAGVRSGDVGGKPLEVKN